MNNPPRGLTAPFFCLLLEGTGLDHNQLRRIARLLYYYSIAQQKDVVVLSVSHIAKLALIETKLAKENIYRLGSMMGSGCHCRVVRQTLEITLAQGLPNQVRRVFGYWVREHGKSKSVKLTHDRRKKIRARLNEGYTVRQIERGIEGILCSHFHVDNAFTDITHVCATGAKLDRLIDLSKRRRIHTGQGILGHMSKVTS